VVTSVLQNGGFSASMTV